MASWDKISSQGNVQDRRGTRSVALGGGLGVTGLLLFVVFNYLSGGDIGDVLTTLENAQVSPVQSYDVSDFEGKDSYEVFAGKVLGSANEMWSTIFRKNAMTYNEPQLVLFRGSTQSSCGGADSSSGPHYCPLDHTIYLDETFFEELTKKFGAEGGDVAEAYVIAHEVGHHIQEELQGLSENGSQEESIAIELQADCYAGLWAHSVNQLGVFEEGEIKEAIDAAAAVGDDRIQAKVNGRVDKESWTHGSSVQRVSAFTRGYQTGSVDQCDI